mmetsp:Transcript_16022/g.36822  ORF Transcript_16022/g.36822 Transcript_16022/m.36822 type:complete len:237 (+) Transcript_16022:29-739(+)
MVPRRIVAKESCGKINYVHTRIEATKLRFLKGIQLLQKYYVSREDKTTTTTTSEETTVSAHAFCSRCGIYVLHAPSANSNVLDVNVSCLHERKAKLVGKNNLSEGTALEGQWGEDDSAQKDTTPSKNLFGPNRRDEFSRLLQTAWNAPIVHTQSTPETPSTGTTNDSGLAPSDSEGTNETDSIGLAAATTTAVATLPTPTTSAIPLRSFSSPDSVVSPSTAPVIRDKMKHYMSKHL